MKIVCSLFCRVWVSINCRPRFSIQKQEAEDQEGHKMKEVCFIFWVFGISGGGTGIMITYISHDVSVCIPELFWMTMGKEVLGISQGFIFCADQGNLFCPVACAFCMCSHHSLRKSLCKSVLKFLCDHQSVFAVCPTEACFYYFVLLYQLFRAAHLKV